MLNNPKHNTPTDIEEMARRRVWARVQIGMAADRRRRIRRAWLAAAAGAVTTTIFMLLLLF